MLRVGLTGGMAAGKSTVASMLRAHDYPVLDADTIGHELLEEGQDAYKDVVATFGIDVLDQHGNIDRAELGKIVFAEPEKLKVLNTILHPRIGKVVEDWFAALARSSDPPDIAVVEAALLFESGFSHSLDKMMVCWCRPEQQVERMLERGLTEDEAKQRIAAQMPNEEKLKLADATIDCSGTIEETERLVASALAKLIRSSAPPQKPA
ncbi:MAG: dephospho-CoA kinase [Candidatus Acidiferrales bacterium]|jgi:dephospho-CoA kinase